MLTFATMVHLGCPMLLASLLSVALHDVPRHLPTPAIVEALADQRTMMDHGIPSGKLT